MPELPEYWLAAWVVSLVILLVIKERVAGSVEPAAQRLGRRLNLAIFPLLAAFWAYVLLTLVRSLA